MKLKIISILIATNIFLFCGNFHLVAQEQEFTEDESWEEFEDGDELFGDENAENIDSRILDDEIEAEAEVINDESEYNFNYEKIDKKNFDPKGYWRIIKKKRINLAKSRFRDITESRIKSSCIGDIIHIGQEELTGNSTCLYNYCKYGSYEIEEINLKKIKENLEYSDFIRALVTALYHEVRNAIIHNIKFLDVKSPFVYHDLYVLNNNAILVYYEEVVYFLYRDESLLGYDVGDVVAWEQKGRFTNIKGYGSSKLLLKLDNPQNYPYLRIILLPPVKGKNNLIVGSILTDKGGYMRTRNEFEVRDVNYYNTATLEYSKFTDGIIVIDISTYNSSVFPWKLRLSFVKK